ncbi:MAG: ABC transporter permease [Candidatus Entotheonellia bacterium]
MQRLGELQTETLVLRRGGRQGDRPWRRFLGRLVRHQPLGMAGGILVLLLILVAIFADQLAPYDPKEAIFDIYHPPNRAFVMGTDHLGRDIFSRVVWGARLSLYVGLVSVSVGISIGALWGIVTGYFGGIADSLSQRVVDTLMGFPPLILALSLMAVLEQSVHNVIITLAILLIPAAARTLRSTTLSLKEMGYVESARAMGASHWRIIFGHILPNSLATYIVLFTVNIAYAIVVEAALSFLGLGAPADEPSWGGMLNGAAHAIQRAPWIALFPGLAISLAVFGLNMLGDAVRDLTDVKLRGRESQSA